MCFAALSFIWRVNCRLFAQLCFWFNYISHQHSGRSCIVSSSELFFPLSGKTLHHRVLYSLEENDFSACSGVSFLQSENQPADLSWMMQPALESWSAGRELVWSRSCVPSLLRCVDLRLCVWPLYYFNDISFSVITSKSVPVPLFQLSVRQLKYIFLPNSTYKWLCFLCCSLVSKTQWKCKTESRTKASWVPKSSETW